MPETDFLESKYTTELLLFNIYDVDEFVLREVERIKNSNALEIWNVANAKRYSYEVYPIGDNEYEEDEISTREYLDRKEEGDHLCFTKLNYKEFEKEFPLDYLDLWYGQEWLYDFQYNEAFFPAVKEWIDKTNGDASKMLRLRSLLIKIGSSTHSLTNIASENDSSMKLNDIQKKVIEIHLRFNNHMSEAISAYYSKIFPELFKNYLKKDEVNKPNKNQNQHTDIFKDDNYSKFIEYTKYNILDPFVDYSYLFQRMLFEKRIHKKTHKEYFQWLFENEFISEKRLMKFLDEKSFRSLIKSTSANRIKDYNKIFDT